MSEENLLLSKLTHLEDRFENSNKKFETRLDLLVELMTKVTLLQERELKNSTEINELKALLKEQMVNNVEMVKRLHSRIDSSLIEMNSCRHTLEVDSQQIENTLKDEIKKVDQLAVESKERIDMWLNRGKGAWMIASILLLVIQGIGVYAIEELKSNVKAIQINKEEQDAKNKELEDNNADLWQALKKHIDNNKNIEKQ